MQKDLQNLKYLPWFSALRSFDALMPFYVLYTQQCGLSYLDIFITQVIFSVALLLFDVPLGIYSDLYGRRRSLLIGGIASCLGYCLFVFWPVFWGFALGEIALALSFAACSGVDTSLLFETTKRLNQEASYCEQEGKYQAYGRYSEAISAILAGSFALFSLTLPAVMTWLFSFPSLFISLLLHDKTITSTQSFSDIFRTRVQDQIRTMTTYFIKQDRRIVWILLYSGLLSAMIINTFWLLQVFLKTYHVNYFLIGILCFTYHSTSGFVASRTSKIIDRFKGISLILPLLFQCMAIVLGITNSAWFFPVFLLAAIVFGIKMPFIYNLLHRQVEDKVRAGILSLDSFCTRLLFSVIAIPIGWILDNASLNMAFLCLTIPNLLVFWIVIANKI